MANGSTKPGDAVADKARDEFEKNRRERELAITRLEIRAQMRSATDEDEDSGIIHQRALEAQRRKDSEAPPSGTIKAVAGVVRGMKSDWAKVVLLVALAALAAFVYLRTR